MYLVNKPMHPRGYCERYEARFSDLAALPPFLNLPEDVFQRCVPVWAEHEAWFNEHAALIAAQCQTVLTSVRLLPRRYLRPDKAKERSLNLDTLRHVVSQGLRVYWQLRPSEPFDYDETRLL